MKLTEDFLLENGFEKVPYFTITNTIFKDLGRNRILSIGCVGTPNEMVWICEVDRTDPKKINDLVCLRNYDYDGYTTQEELLEIYSIITNNKNHEN